MRKVKIALLVLLYLATMWLCLPIPLYFVTIPIYGGMGYLIGVQVNRLRNEFKKTTRITMDKSKALKHIEETYRLIPMSDITDEARELARRWYDGVSEMNDIKEKHKLASDIMNYASQHAKEFAKWLDENTTIKQDGKTTLYHYCNSQNEWGDCTLADIYLEFEEHLKRK